MPKKSLTQKSSYFYDLPEELIAQYPKDKRDSSRLLVYIRNQDRISHEQFPAIINYLKSGDVLVLNKTKVFPARLFAEKTSTGAKVEILLLDNIDNDTWECMVRPAKRIKKGTEVKISKQLSAKVSEEKPDGIRIMKFVCNADFWEIIEAVGKMPLPPYIKRDATDRDKQTYQTVYAQERGSVAAPTAGLHLTEEILGKLKNRGVEIHNVLLHVGLGTFQPVKEDDILKHKMHSEYCSISEETATAVNIAKKEKRRIIAVGTTSTRTLESFAENGRLKAGSHHTDLFIYPGKKFQIIDGLLTNFHLPESTLIMLVAAFAGYENTMNLYKTAVKESYRFFSYGDAMLIL